MAGPENMESKGKKAPSEEQQAAFDETHKRVNDMLDALQGNKIGSGRQEEDSKRHEEESEKF